MTRLQAARIKAHRNNLDRYCRLLSTQLTELERNYLHKRIAEEHAALSRLQAEAGAMEREGTAHPDAVIAAAAMAQKGDGHSHQ